MSLASQVQLALARVGSEFKAIRTALDGKEEQIPVSATAPSSPIEGQFWLNPTAVETAAPNLVVGPVNPGMTMPGLWIETGLGADGSDFTLWIEDGT